MASGRYNLELHGCGGSGAAMYASNRYYVSGGGGSGNLQEVNFISGEGWSIVIGTPNNDGTTSIKNLEGTTYSLAKGGDAESSSAPGYGLGNIAGDGGYIYSQSPPTQFENHIGWGNINNTNQTYGNGGIGIGEAYRYSEQLQTIPGNPGAVIITYLGD